MDCLSPKYTYVFESARGKLDYRSSFTGDMDKFCDKLMTDVKKKRRANKKKLSKTQTPMTPQPLSRAKTSSKLSLSSQKKRDFSTPPLSRDEMLDRLLTSVNSSIYRLVRSKVDVEDDYLRSALGSEAVLNLLERHLRDENIFMVDEKEE